MFVKICPAEDGKGWNFAKSRLCGDQILKTNLYTKIRDPVFYRFLYAVLSLWVKDALFYMYKYV